MPPLSLVVFALLAAALWAAGLWAFSRRTWQARASGGVLLLGAAWLSLFLVASLVLHLAARSYQGVALH